MLNVLKSFAESFGPGILLLIRDVSIHNIELTCCSVYERPHVYCFVFVTVKGLKLIISLAKTLGQISCY